MEPSESKANNCSEVTTKTTFVDEHEDGSVTKTEVSTSVTKKRQIEYSFQRKSTVVLKADDNDKKYADKLGRKEEFAVFVGKVNPIPVTFVRNQSVVKVLALIGKTFEDGYDEVVFGIYTMREITAIKMAVKKTHVKPNDYKFDYQKRFELDTNKDERWKLIEVCDDVMGTVDEELEKLKQKGSDENGKEEDGKEEETKEGENMEGKNEEDKPKEEEDTQKEEVSEKVKEDKDIVKEAPPQKFRMSYSLKKTPSKLISDHLPFEDEIIEEDQLKRKIKRKYKLNDEIVREMIIIEPKPKLLFNRLIGNIPQDLSQEIPPESSTEPENPSSSTEPNPPSESADNTLFQLPSKPKPLRKPAPQPEAPATTLETPTIANSEQIASIKNIYESSGGDKDKPEQSQPLATENSEQIKSIKNIYESSNKDTNHPNKISLKPVPTQTENSEQIKSIKNIFESTGNDKRKQLFPLKKRDNPVELNLQDKLAPVPQNVVLSQVPTEHTEPLDWDLYSYEKIIPTTKKDFITTLCYCPTLNNGKPAIVTGHQSGNIYAWDIDKDTKIKTYSEHTNKIWDLCKIFFTSKLRQIFTSISEDSYLKIWDSSSSSKSAISIKYKEPLTAIDIHPSNYIIFASKERTLYCQQVDFGRKGELIKGDKFKENTTHESLILRICILDQGSIHNTYVVTGSENTLQLHKVDFSRRKFFIHKEFPNAHKGVIRDILDITNMQFLTCGDDHLIKVWDITMDKEIRAIDTVSDTVIYSLMNVFVADAFVFGSEDKKMKIVSKWKILNQEEGEYQPKVHYEYDRKEAAYKMVYLKDNDLYSLAAIDNGCSTNVYMWGNNMIMKKELEEKKEKAEEEEKKE